ncbi:MAG: class I SAM-dependent methyltransferase [Woeseia sp.]|nr:class I SAM-dependent methyltransferase [Woeseia sp.]
MQRIAGFLVLFFAIATSNADEQTEQKVREAMDSDVRNAAETARDRNRRPVETLAFFGLKDDMRVLELLPGGGWYTKLLAPVLREDGKLFVSIGTNGVKERLLTQPGFDRVEVLEIDASIERDGPFRTNSIGSFDFGVKNLDLVLTFRNMHNFTPAGRANINAAAFKALRSGGHYGVVDHSRRHMEPMTAENRRRADAVEIIKEALEAGFEFAGFSDLHYRPDDELRYEVGRKSVTGNTDRFTLLFEKP